MTKLKDIRTAEELRNYRLMVMRILSESEYSGQVSKLLRKINNAFDDISRASIDNRVRPTRASQIRVDKCIEEFDELIKEMNEIVFIYRLGKT